MPHQSFDSFWRGNFLGKQDSEIANDMPIHDYKGEFYSSRHQKKDGEKTLRRVKEKPESWISKAFLFLLN